MALACFRTLGVVIKCTSLSNCRSPICKVPVLGYAKKIAGKMGGASAQKVVLDVESDPEKLTKFCCGANIYIDGQDPEIKPDSEYPDWLWTLRTERGAPSLDELDQNSMYYWRRLRKLNNRRKNRLSKTDRIKN